jgi:hypothetical protein
MSEKRLKIIGRGAASWKKTVRILSRVGVHGSDKSSDEDGAARAIEKNVDIALEVGPH